MKRLVLVVLLSLMITTGCSSKTQPQPEEQKSASEETVDVKISGWDINEWKLSDETRRDYDANIQSSYTDPFLVFVKNYGLVAVENGKGHLRVPAIGEDSKIDPSKDCTIEGYVLPTETDIKDVSINKSQYNYEDDSLLEWTTCDSMTAVDLHNDWNGVLLARMITHGQDGDVDSYMFIPVMDGKGNVEETLYRL